MAVLAALFASSLSAEVPQEARDAQIVVLGEQHDNPDHHTRQAEWVAALQPTALVFEMLTPEQAERAGEGWSDQKSLDALIGWSESSWPSFDMYYPIFAAAPKAKIYGGGVPREALRVQIAQPLAQHRLAAQFGLDQPLDPDEQVAREALQARAHCGALPKELLPMMVDAQRVRDVTLAHAALTAISITGGPIVVITGNGHARTDWGMPAAVSRVSEVTAFALAQGEDGGAVQGDFSLTLDAPAPPRGDPCAAFKE